VRGRGPVGSLHGPALARQTQEGTGDNRADSCPNSALSFSGHPLHSHAAMFAVLFFALVVGPETGRAVGIFELIAGYLIILTATELGFTLELSWPCR